MNYFNAFWVGGLLCVIGQILIDKTKLTPARILVAYVVAGVFLQLLGLYQPIVDYAGAGATVPLTGFGYSLGKGVEEAVAKEGFVGIFTGGLSATAGGICAVILFSIVAALLVKPKMK
ncbi:MAG: stage V sporulation protein AE [Clostridia bacterium]|nr:stage V sporulation protein AE [Clostridia bacterium]